MAKVCQAAIDLIKKYESLQLSAYPDPASAIAVEMRKSPRLRKPGWQGLPGDPWTIGYGATGKDRFNLDANGKPTLINKGLVWTKEQAESRLQSDVESFADQVKKIVTVTLTDNQFGALVSLAFNIGVANVSKSTLLKKLNAGDFAGAADEFLSWNKARVDGSLQVLSGLTKRRQAERELFLS